MSISSLRVGLVGCGSIASYFHLPVLLRLPGVTLVAVADPDPGARARAARLARVPVHERASELIARKDLDAVVICAPSGLHAELGIEAAACGRDLFLEKPIATNLADGRRLLSEVSKANVIAAVGFNRRFHPLFERARALLDAGRIGRVRSVHAVHTVPSSSTGLPAWKQRRDTGGGVLLDLASHHVDLVRWCLHDEVVSVAATIESRTTEHDTASMNAALSGGARVLGFYAFGPGPADHLEFVGDTGVLRVDWHRPVVEIHVPRRFRDGRRRAWVRPSVATAMWRAYRKVRPGRNPSFARTLQAFVQTVGGATTEIASLEDGLRSLETVAAAERSALAANSAAVVVD